MNATGSSLYVTPFSAYGGHAGLLQYISQKYIYPECVPGTGIHLKLMASCFRQMEFAGSEKYWLNSGVSHSALGQRLDKYIFKD